MIYTALGCTRLVTDFVELPVVSAPLPGANQNSFTTITPLHHFVATTTADSSSNQFMDLEIPGREYVCFTTTILRCPPKLRQGGIESCIEVSMYISRNASLPHLAEHFAAPVPVIVLRKTKDRHTNVCERTGRLVLQRVFTYHPDSDS
jgi:hypothetical protein